MYTVRQGDTAPAPWRVSEEESGDPVDLTGATIIVRARLRDSATAIQETAAVVGDPSEGVFEHSTATWAPGVYEVTVRIGGSRTAPTERNALLRVLASI